MSQDQAQVQIQAQAHTTQSSQQAQVLDLSSTQAQAYMQTEDVIPITTPTEAAAPSASSTKQMHSGTAAGNTVPATTLSPASVNLDTRTHVVGELYDTERSYVESLQILVEKYIRPLKSLDSNRMLIESNLVDEIFYTIPEILQHHENFLSALQDRLSSDWDTSQMIGNVFIKAFTNQQIIDTYTAFINNWKNARQAIKVATQAKPAFERFLEAMSREHRNKLTLDALLIMPVQRIPRYELLIKELLKHTAEDHPDYGPLMEAQRKIHELALKIDRAEKEMIHQEQLKDLESMIEGHVELQNPQRDFIRYDLVTIVGTVTKKERVLFLFCDLLIMTSVKKKASRRSNLQTAFANSANDLSLLEGNKFKLLMRVPLDHIEIRLSNDQIQIQQQYQEHQHQLQIQQQSKFIHEKKDELESDLYILNQIESLSSKMIVEERSKINEVVNELTSQLKQKLFKLERDELKLLSGSQQAFCQHLSQMPYETSNLLSSTTSASILSPSMQSSSTVQTSTLGHQPYVLSNNSPGLISSGSPSTAVSNQNDSDTSLEFLISNNNHPIKDSLSTEMSALNIGTEFLSGEQGYMIANQGENQIIQQLSNCDSLVVTFPTIERRQAFLLAFIEVKQHRYQQQQRQQQQFPKMYSSSVTLKLSHSPDRRSLSHESHSKTKLQHQDNFETCQSMSTNQSPVFANKLSSKCLKHQYPANQQLTAKTSSSSSAPQPTCVTTIVHQMSAPQALNLPSASDNGKEHQQSLSRYNVASSEIEGHQHHHHQLMHQSKNSHTAFLDTICCNDQHNNDVTNSASRFQMNRFTHMDDSILIDQAVAREQQNQYLDYCNRLDCSVNNNNNSNNDNLGPSINLSTIHTADEARETVIANEFDKVRHVNKANPLAFLSSTPKFVLTLPLNFLVTQHPALQFACSTLQNISRETCGLKSTFSSGSRQQTVSDNLGQMWLCMSNGYVSHVALITIKKTRGNPSSYAKDEWPDTQRNPEKSFNFIPIIQAAGDICKSQINCAAQVRWMKRVCSSETIDNERPPIQESVNNSFPNKIQSNTQISETKEEEPQRKSSSQPIDIKPVPFTMCKVPESVSRSQILSESAPSPLQADGCLMEDQSLVRIANTSASTTRLELPALSATDRLKNTSRNSRRSMKNNHVEGGFRKSPQAIVCNRQQQHSLKHRLPTNLPTPPHHTVSIQGATNHRTCFTEAHRLNHTHSHHHHLHRLNHQNNNNYVANLYTGRHNTVPVGELRKAFKQQNRVSDFCSLSHSYNQYLELPNNTLETTKAAFPTHQRVKSLDLAERGAVGRGVSLPNKKDRSTTPPASYNVGKSFRSARLLRHQASLKTSSILAKLVNSASKKSSYLRKSGQASDKRQQKQQTQSSSTGISINDTSGPPNEQPQKNLKQADTISVDSSILNLTSSGNNKHLLSASRLDENNVLISPLSSVSSLASTNSSITVNSACASSPNRSCCDLQVHSLSSSYCNRPSWKDQSYFSNEDFNTICGLRSRSATVPSQAFYQLTSEKDRNVVSTEGYQRLANQKVDDENTRESYKINDLIGDFNENKVVDTISLEKEKIPESSLWLGCEDGSLIIIQCLNSSNDNYKNGSQNYYQENLICGNRHTEVKLGAAICEICVHHDDLVLVALSNGQLAVFSRDNDNNGLEKGAWLLMNPNIVTIAKNEYEFTSKLCLVNNNYVWYSYGRNIFVLNLNTFKLETTLMVPTNDPTLQLTMQSITIAYMEPLSDHSGIWISFKNSHLLQLYDAASYKLLIEINLFDSVNSILSQGNEILRQHKTACLKATSLLNVKNSKEQCDTLYIGTSAGLILYLNVTNQKVLLEQQSVESQCHDRKPQLSGLRHGHCGPVKFLHLIKIGESVPQNQQLKETEGSNNTNQSLILDGTEETFLISGGKGVDLYAPSADQQVVQHCNSDEDDMNHLLFWKV